MGMEPFDYLTYKRNKKHNIEKEELSTKEKKIVLIACFITFVAFFAIVTLFVTSKTSKIDIEYGRLGKAPKIADDVPNEYSNEKETRNRVTIDSRLFLIQQEEKGPSESKVVERMPEQTEVISKAQFKEILTNNEEVTSGIEKQSTEKQTTEQPKPKEQNFAPVTLNETKAAIMPKLPVNKPKPLYEPQVQPAKVLIGKYYSLDEARDAQLALPPMAGFSTFVKKMSTYYSLQVGSFDNFETAKNVAGKLRARGLDAWIYQ